MFVSFEAIELENLHSIGTKSSVGIRSVFGKYVKSLMINIKFLKFCKFILAQVSSKLRLWMVLH